METEKARAKRYKDYFNLTIDQWEILDKFQNSVCYACGLRPASGIRLAVDHDHASGRLRGLLCNHCNHLLGKVENLYKRYPNKSTPLATILIRLWTYLQIPPAVTALGKEVFTYPGRLGTKAHRKWLRKKAKNTDPSQTIYEGTK